MPKLSWFVGLAISLVVQGAAAVEAAGPPEPLREFRGVWVATAGNIDWPSRQGLTANDQKAEFRAILERAVELKLNAVLLQVRSVGDAFYESSLAPWSPYLTGRMGVSPGFDPLAFAITEAHTRGIELHAWFNPFRASTASQEDVSDGHVSRQHPEWIREYDGQLWLDPGEGGALEHSLATILEVVRRYEVDGVQVDDTLYPHPAANRVAFPDEASFRSYRDGGGSLERDDWRRENANRFVRLLYERVKATKRTVKVGLSPSGIWRPGHPETITASLDAFSDLYADSRKWLGEGWCDYFAPQLYWSISQRRQSFPVLLEWWTRQNPRGRHVWPGVATERIGPARPAQEIVNQISITRDLLGRSPGHVHWNKKALLANRGRIVDELRAETYAHFALIPPSPWLGDTRPGKPIATASDGRINWRVSQGEAPRWWLIQARLQGEWASQLVPGTRTSGPLPRVEAIAVRAVDAAGNLGEATVLELR